MPDRKHRLVPPPEGRNPPRPRTAVPPPFAPPPSLLPRDVGLSESDRAGLERGTRQAVIVAPSPIRATVGDGPYRSTIEPARVPTLRDVLRVLVAFLLRRPVR